MHGSGEVREAGGEGNSGLEEGGWGGGRQIVLIFDVCLISLAAELGAKCQP